MVPESPERPPGSGVSPGIRATLNRAKAQAHRIQCLNNQRQLGATWMLYSSDNNESLVPNGAKRPDDGQRETLWVLGDYHNFPQAFTNEAFPLDPTDSMRRHLSTRYQVFSKSSDIPTPAGTFTFQDLTPRSLRTPAFIVLLPPVAQDQFFHFPATHHNRGGVIGFADGHVEAHRWRDPRTIRTAAAGVKIGHHIRAPGNLDLAWIHGRTTALR